MYIKYHLYNLLSPAAKENTIQGNRKGALLQITFDDGLIGYSDCHPWPEVGDHPIHTQLQKLMCKTPTLLTRCSLKFARLDAEARSKGKSLLDETKVPLSHFLIQNILDCSKIVIKNIASQGFTHVKVKMGKFLPQEISKLLELFIGENFKLRIDFNESLSEKEFYAFLQAIKPLHDMLDFIEDPFPYDPVKWKKCQKKCHVRLACDRQSVAARFFPESAEILILKPAVQQIDLFESIPREKIIITSYLDHPLGQLGAAYTASQFDVDKKNIHGLLSHYSYQQNPFSQSLSQTGSLFKVPSGNGFGFDTLLEKIEWKEISPHI